MAESSIFRREDVQKLLRALRDGRIQSIEPLVEKAEVKYPSVEEETGLHGKALRDLLDELSKIGILMREVYENRVVCPVCGSHLLAIQLSCPTCGSPKLISGSVIEHLTCGYLDLEEGFRKGELLVCPKCGRTLKAIGVDYRKPGVMYKCGGCGKFSSSPRRRYTCSEGHVFEEGDALIGEICVYKLNPEKRSIIERETLELKPIIDELVRGGWRGEIPAVLRDESGVEYEFKFALWAPGNEVRVRPDVVADVYVSDGDVEPTVVFAFFAKTIRFLPGDKILVVMPRLDGKAREYARSFNVSVVEAESPSKLMEGLRSLLLDIASKRSRKMLEDEAKALEGILRELEKYG